MEKYFKNCTTSLADFYHHPLSYISDLFNPLTDIKWFLKPNLKQEQVSEVREVCLAKPAFKELNVPQNNPAYITNMCWKHRNNMDRSKIIANAHIRPKTADECWDQCSTQSKTLVEEIERLERMIRELAHPNELASIHEQKSFAKSQTGNKKVQASIHSNHNDKSCVCGLPKSPDGKCSEINRSKKSKSQMETKRSKSKLKSFSKQKQSKSKVNFDDDDFSVVVSKERKKDKSSRFKVASKPSQSKDDLQEIFSRPSSTSMYPVAPQQSIQKHDKTMQSSVAIKPQETLICAQCGGAGEAIKHRHNGCCSHRGRVPCYHNYITLPVEKSKTDDRALQALSNELERQKAELQRVKDTLHDLIIRSRAYEEKQACTCPKNYREREMHSSSRTNGGKEVYSCPRTYGERDVCPCTRTYREKERCSSPYQNKSPETYRERERCSCPYQNKSPETYREREMCSCPYQNKSPGSYREREVCVCPYRNKSPTIIVPEKQYNDVGVSQTTAEVIQEDVAEENICPANTADEKLTFSTTSQTSAKKKKCFKCKTREKATVAKKKKCFWRCCC